MSNITIRNNCTFRKSEPMRVYRNLHQKCWSVQQKDSKGRWKVVAHAESITLADCVFRVSEAGRQRVLSEGRKNVHAYIQGFYVPDNKVIHHVWHCLDEYQQPAAVMYNPTDRPCFHHGGKEVTFAPIAHMPKDRWYVMGWIKKDLPVPHDYKREEASIGEI